MVLRDIATVVMGISPKGGSVNLLGDGVPLLNGPTEFGSFSPVPTQYTTTPVRESEPGDLLFCVRGSTTGRMNWADQKYAIGRGIAALRHKSGLSYQPYLRAVIEYKLDFLLQSATGSTFPNVSKQQLEDLEIPLLSLPKQRAIAEVLGALDEKIELNRKMNATLDELARTIFRSWFVDFDPVRAKMEGREPVGMDAATAALFPDRLVDSMLGSIPEGWEVKRVDEVADLNKSSIKARDEWESIQYVDISSTREGDITELSRFNRGDEPSRARRRLKHGDTALSTVRPNRRSFFLALNPPDDLIASTGFAVVSPHTVPWSFLHSALTQDSVFETLGNLADGGAYPAVRPNVIGELPVRVPSDEALLRAYHESAAPLYELAASNREESRTLAELRDTLLPELISGRIRVPDAERLASAVV